MAFPSVVTGTYGFERRREIAVAVIPLDIARPTS